MVVELLPLHHVPVILSQFSFPCIFIHQERLGHVGVKIGLVAHASSSLATGRHTKPGCCPCWGCWGMVGWFMAGMAGWGANGVTGLYPP